MSSRRSRSRQSSGDQLNDLVSRLRLLPEIRDRCSDKMEGRKWEDLNMDCLVNIFGRVGMESLVLDVPLVCKSWYKATLSSLCWQRLVFPNNLEHTRLVGERRDKWNFNPKRLIMFVVNRSQRSATELVLPTNCTEEVLIYVSEECPALKFLALPFGADYNPADLIRKWKNLEMLKLGGSDNMQEILAQISIHCNNFVALCVTRADIGIEEAFAIVTYLPNIKYLFLRQAYIGRENLVTILEGCKELVHLDVRDCVGFEEDDDEILKLASRITTFKCEGSTTYDYDDDMYGHIDVDSEFDLGSD